MPNHIRPFEEHPEIGIILDRERYLDDAVPQQLIFGAGIADVYPDQTVPPNGRTLTTPQIMTLSLLAIGCTSEHIADTLAIPQSTVKSQIARVRSKMDVHTTPSAIGTAYRCGMFVVRSAIQPADLTPPERLALAGKSGGKRVKEVATERDRSFHTVRVQLRTTYRKLRLTGIELATDQAAVTLYHMMKLDQVDE